MGWNISLNAIDIIITNLGGEFLELICYVSREYQVGEGWHRILENLYFAYNILGFLNLFL